MSIWIMKPIDHAGVLVGGVLTFETDDSVTNTNTALHYLSSSGTETSLPNAGITESNLSTADWSLYSGSSHNFGYLFGKVSGVTSANTTPTITNVNASKLISETFHGSHSNSSNGLDYNANVSGEYEYNASNLTIHAQGEVISFSYLASSSSHFEPTTFTRTQNNDNGNVYYNGILVGSQTGGGSDDGLAWYQDEASTNYFDDISESNFFNNATDVTNKRKNHKRAMTSLAESTSTDAIEKFTKLMNLKLLDRIIDADDYRDAERFALSRLTDSEQTEIKNIIRYS
tara:strand:- start:337 stop:1194 length:858 start_codon:yes stop_codon:yes gene_type:complete